MQRFRALLLRLRPFLYRYWAVVLAAGVAGLLFLAVVGYTMLRIDVPAGHVAVLTSKTGDDIDNADAVAPTRPTRACNSPSSPRAGTSTTRSTGTGPSTRWSKCPPARWACAF